ncbi:hypothetical protein LP52_11265 [Streptomonospora alba]|uniref:Uncharacterized protein n=1 Tax=Streptomonospora alba TaxID=183763 RepID=A0A0C2G601_9ACTN|nr:hypothetical protein [Streptomonospora alba]KIH98718.1 hypothetical protein LP52_11265 [Streptomonospora alba]
MKRTLHALAPGGYTPRQPEPPSYERVVELTLAHPDWCIAYDADSDGRIVYRAVRNGAGIAVAAQDVRVLAALVRAAEEVVE